MTPETAAMFSMAAAYVSAACNRGPTHERLSEEFKEGMTELFDRLDVLAPCAGQSHESIMVRLNKRFMELSKQGATGPGEPSCEFCGNELSDEGKCLDPECVDATDPPVCPSCGEDADPETFICLNTDCQEDKA